MGYDGPLTGGCQCGAVRYAVRKTSGEPSICHCRMCQKAAGNYFAAFAAPAHLDDVTVTRGAFSVFVSSGTGERLFCDKCGTSLGFRSTTGPTIWVSAGSVDDPTLLMPHHQSGGESRLPWLDAALETPQGFTEQNSNPNISAYAHRRRPDNSQHPDHDTAEWPLR